MLRHHHCHLSFLSGKKEPFQGPFQLKPNSPGQPGLDGRGAVLSFPFLQLFVVATFGFDDYASVRDFIDLKLASLTGAETLGLEPSKTLHAYHRTLSIQVRW